MLRRLCGQGLDSAAPDARGNVPAVDAWGDVDRGLTLAHVEAVAAAGVDFSAVRLDTGWTVLSDVSRDFPPDAAVVQRLREETERSMARLTPRERMRRLSRMAANVHPQHQAWFKAFRAAQVAEASLPPARTGPVAKVRM